MTFEPVTDADVEPLTAVMKRAFDEDARRHLGEESGGPPGYDDGSFIRKWYFEPNVCAWKVSLSGELIGAIAVFININGENYLGHIFVDTPFQDKGCGMTIWRFVESHTQQRCGARKRPVSLNGITIFTSISAVSELFVLKTRGIGMKKAT